MKEEINIDFNPFEEGNRIKFEMQMAQLTGEKSIRSELPPLVEAIAQVARIEQKVDRLTALVERLLDSLAEDADPEDLPDMTLDGETAGGERDQSQPL